MLETGAICEIYVMQQDSNLNDSFRKRTLNHFVKLTSLAKWLSVRLQTKSVPLQSLMAILYIIAKTKIKIIKKNSN